LGAGEVDRIIADLPFGKKHGSRDANQSLYPEVMGEAERVLKLGGKAALLTREVGLLEDAIKRRMSAKGVRIWYIEKRTPLKLGTILAEVFLVKKVANDDVTREREKKERRKEGEERDKEAAVALKIETERCFMGVKSSNMVPRSLLMRRARTLPQRFPAKRVREVQATPSVELSGGETSRNGEASSVESDSKVASSMAKSGDQKGKKKKTNGRKKQKKETMREKEEETKEQDGESKKRKEKKKEKKKEKRKTKKKKGEQNGMKFPDGTKHQKKGSRTKATSALSKKKELLKEADTETTQRKKKKKKSGGDQVEIRMSNASSKKTTKAKKTKAKAKKVKKAKEKKKTNKPK